MVNQPVTSEKAHADAPGLNVGVLLPFYSDGAPHFIFITLHNIEIFSCEFGPVGAKSSYIFTQMFLQLPHKAKKHQ